jgi:hypothetical protein
VVRPESYDWAANDEDLAGQRWQRVMSYVEAVEKEQSDLYDRFVKLAWLYDPNRRASDALEEERRVGSNARVQENLIAANCDTITGVIASTEIRARMMTDGAEWSAQRRAKQLEIYAEELGKMLAFNELGERCFHESSLKGTSLGYVGLDRFNKLCAERVMPDEIVVDQQEANGGEPLQLAWRKMVPKRRLMAMYPEHEEAIRNAQTMRGATWRYWADYRPINRDEIVFVRIWHLPIGEEGQEGYVPGRYVECIDGTDLKDEPYHKAYFPFAVMRWTKRPDGWFGIGGAERIVGHQRALNKINWQIDRQLDQYAVPTTWVHQSDQNIQVKTVNRFGTMGVYKVKEPKTVFPTAVSPEMYNRRTAVIDSGHREFGQSQMATGAMKPAGLDSGVALREYKDQTTDRFAIQEKEFERFRLRLTWLALECCKDMAAAGIEPPEIVRKTRKGKRALRWADVDMGEVQVQLMASSNLSRTPAGRNQLVMEWAQAGVISKDSAVRLIDHPDLEREISLYTAAQEYIEFCLEEILDGEVVVPTPHMNLRMAVWRGMAQYQLAAMDRAPESVLENLHQFVVLASYEVSLAEQPAQAPAMAGAGMAAPAMPPGMAPPGLPPGAPMPPMDGMAPPPTPDMMGGFPGDPMKGASVWPIALAG